MNNISWNNGINMAQTFTVIKGYVLQDGILSPYPVNVYIDELSTLLNDTSTGCMFNSVRINHLFYADDADYWHHPH